MTKIKYYNFDVWVIFEGNAEATPFFDLVACDIKAAGADIEHSFGSFTLLNYTQKNVVKEVIYNF